MTISDQGAEGAQEAARLRQAQIRKADRGVKEIDAKFGAQDRAGQAPHRDRRGQHIAKVEALAEEAVERCATAVEKEPITIVCSAKGWLRALKGHQEQSDAIKYREGDRARFWVHAQTTDKLMMFATDGRFFTLDCAKLPGGRGNGEAIRTFIDLPPEADIVDDVRACAGPQAAARRHHRSWLRHQRRRRRRHDQERQARDECEAGRRSGGRAASSTATPSRWWARTASC